MKLYVILSALDKCELQCFNRDVYLNSRKNHEVLNGALWTRRSRKM